METKKTDAFLKYIRKSSKAQCKAVEAETEKVRAIRLQEFKAEAEKKYKDYVAYELDRISAKTNRAISDLQAESRKDISALRQSFCDEIFEAVQAKLKTYRTTKAYQNRLLQDVKTLSEKLSDANPILLLSKEDSALEGAVKTAFHKPCQIRFCDDILYGGIKGLHPTSQQIFDFTLDTELQKEQLWFLEHADLSVEE